MRTIPYLLAGLCAALLTAAAPPAAAASLESDMNACRELSGPVGLDACNHALARMAPDLPPEAFAEMHRNRGILYAQMGRTDEALYELKLAAKLSPRDAKTQYNLGVAYEETGHDWYALQAYRKAVRLDPEMTLAWANLAMAAYHTQRYREAKEAFETVQRMDPGYFDAREEQRAAWGETMQVKPLTVAMRREIAVRFTPSFGYFVKVDDVNRMPVEKVVYMLLDTDAHIQIYKHFFGQASFIYGRTTFKPPSDGSLNIYGLTFGLKIMSRTEVSEPFLTFLDRSRFFASAAVGPYIIQGNDASGTVVVPGTKTSVGVNGGIGYEYFFHPNIAIGITMKLHWVDYTLDQFVLYQVGPTITGRF